MHLDDSQAIFHEVASSIIARFPQERSENLQYYMAIYVNDYNIINILDIFKERLNNVNCLENFI